MRAEGSQIVHREPLTGLLLAAVLAMWPHALPASCDPPSPPAGSGGAWFTAYRNWCLACGGTPSADASPAMCTPGPNWGGNGAGAGATTAEALGREIGAAAGGLIACVLFNQCPGSTVDPVVAELALRHHERINEAQKRQLASAEAQEAAAVAAARQRVQDARTGTGGGLRARDLLAGGHTGPAGAAEDLNRAAALSKLAVEAATPEQAAELANRAFDAAAGGIVDAGVGEGVRIVAADAALEREFTRLRESYSNGLGTTLEALQIEAGLAEQISDVADLRADTRQTAGHAPSVVELEQQAVVVEERLAAELGRHRGAARSSAVQTLESAARLSELIENAVRPPAPVKPEEFMFNRGYVHGVQCFSSNAGPSCSGAASVEAQERCTRSYSAGYRVGAALAQQMLADAAARGRADRAAGRRHSGFTSPAAAGPCRVPWIVSYTEGYSGDMIGASAHPQ